MQRSNFGMTKPSLENSFKSQNPLNMSDFWMDMINNSKICSMIIGHFCILEIWKFLIYMQACSVCSESRITHAFCSDQKICFFVELKFCWKMSTKWRFAIFCCKCLVGEAFENNPNPDPIHFHFQRIKN